MEEDDNNDEEDEVEENEGEGTDDRTKIYSSDEVSQWGWTAEWWAICTNFFENKIEQMSWL